MDWALRDYKVDGQLGLEPTFQEYISKLVEIFDEVRRVLKSSGTCWVVMGDTYSGYVGGYRDKKIISERPCRLQVPNTNTKTHLPDKSLCKIPQRFELAMIDHGWIERSDIIWYKPNCMPSSAKDRFTVDYEHVFFFVKSRKYYFETQYEPLVYPDRPQGDNLGGSKHYARRSGEGGNTPYKTNPLGRIKRCVWKIPTAPFKEAHFATFPEKLVEPMIKAGCPQQICRKCRKAREKIMEFTGEKVQMGWSAAHKFGDRTHTKHNAWKEDNKPGILTKQVKQYRAAGFSDCGCNAGWDSGLVLDPFAGSGTVGVVAAKLARNFLGIEINPDYVKMACKRLEPYTQQQRLTAVH